MTDVRPVFLRVMSSVRRWIGPVRIDLRPPTPLGPRRIRADAIAPGPIRTELGGELSATFEAVLAGQTAPGRVGEAAEVGSVVAGLPSEHNRWIDA